jgi:hypothetical protein
MRSSHPLKLRHQPQTEFTQTLENESPFVTMTPLHRVVVVAIFALFLSWMAIQEFNHPSIANTRLVFLGLAVNSILLLVPVIFYQPSYGWFHPLVFGTFVAAINHLRRVDVYIHGLQWHAALPGWSSEQLTQLLAHEVGLRALGIAACYLGFFLGATTGIPKLKFGQPHRIGFKVLLAVLFSGAIFAVYMQAKGGIVEHILSWGRGRAVSLAGDYYWQFAIQFGLIACLSWLALDRKATRQPFFWGCSVASLAFIFLASGSRSSIIYFMVMGLLTWFLRERKVNLPGIAIIAVIGILVLGILGNFRDSTFAGEINWGALFGESAPNTEDSALTTGAEEVASRGSFFAGAFPILALVPHQVNFLHGSSYLAVLTLPIPRLFWADKPEMIAGQVGETFFNMNVGMPPGAIGEAYWNFGVIGVAIAFVVFGLFLKWLAEVFRKNAGHSTAIVLYILTLFLLQEPSTMSFINWAFMLVPTILFLHAIGAIRFGQASGKL